MKQYMVYRITYNKSEISYDTYSYVGTKEYPDWNDFHFSRRYPLKKAILLEDHNIASLDNDYVHINLLHDIAFCIDLGYRIDFENK